MGKGSKGGYYSSGGGGGSCSCDCDVCTLRRPWTSCCCCISVCWAIYAAILLLSIVPGARLDERPILHSGEMRPIQLKESSVYALETTQFTDQLGLIEAYRINTLPPLLTATTAAEQNKSIEIEVFPIRDTYNFPEQYDWWYQNAWMTPGSRMLLQTSCSGLATLNIVKGDENFGKWSKAANGEEGNTADYQYTSRPTTSGFGTLLYTHTDPANEVYFTVVKSSTADGVTISCSMTVNLTLVSYDLSGLTNRIPPSRQTRELRYSDGHYLLLVAPVPTGGRAWFDIGTHFKQDIPPLLETGPMLGFLFGGLVGLCIVGVVSDRVCGSACQDLLLCRPTCPCCSFNLFECRFSCPCDCCSSSSSASSPTPVASPSSGDVPAVVIAAFQANDVTPVTPGEKKDPTAGLVLSNAPASDVITVQPRAPDPPVVPPPADLPFNRGADASLPPPPPPDAPVAPTPAAAGDAPPPPPDIEMAAVDRNVPAPPPPSS